MGIQQYIRENKKTIVIGLVLWIILIIVLVLPFTCASYTSTHQGEGIDINNFIEVYTSAINPKESIGYIIYRNLWRSFFSKLLVVTIIYLICFIYSKSKNKPNKYKDIEHGSSDWCEHGEQYKILNRKKGIILAEENYLPLDKRGNVKLYDRTAGYLKKHGYKIKVLNLVHPQYSDGYNPLMHINSEIDVDVIANTIVKGQKSGDSNSDPFWDDSAEMLLKALIYYLIATRPEEEQNLESCAELVRAANTNGGNNLLTELMSSLPNDHPARMNYKSIEIAPEKTYSSILSTLQSKLGKFDSKEIAELTSTDTINFEQIGSERTAVYVISSDTHTAYDFLLTIFFSQMIQQLYDFADNNGGRLKEQTFFILDEFANIGRIPDFDKKISTSRSRKISFSVILQNLDQLEAIYDKAYETIIGNCDTHLFLGSNSQKTVEYFSKALGEKTISRSSKSQSRDKDHQKSGTSESEQIMARALMTPDELRRMDNDLCIIFEKGIRPIKANKYYYFKKPMAKEMAELEISHNDIGEIDRGTWRKFNPYNPYVEENDQDKQNKDLKVDSLDDLFDDEPDENSSDSLSEQLESNVEEDNGEQQLPMDDEYDLQKELEAKFDELFGPIDDSSNK